MKKRLISLLLVFAMVLSMLPVTAFAASGEKDASVSLANPFTDVKETDWFYDAVQYARVNNLFKGTSATTFDPGGTMTRGMFVTVLGRMADVDTEHYTGQSAFTDVPSDAYYAPYVAWASKYGVTEGTGDGKFSPDALINRAQMATFFVRYFESFGVDYETGANITTMPADTDSIPSWAKEAALKLWNRGMLNGDGTNFDPEGNATRAQAATLCMRTDQAVDTWYKEPGVASDRVKIDPATGKPVKPDGEGDNTTTTTYYEVKFALGSGQDGTGVTLPETKTYVKDTKISLLPTPLKNNGLFLGWYYDAAMENAVGRDDKVTRNMTLYARMGEVAPVSEQETPNYITVVIPANQVSGYTFGITGYSEDAVEYFNHVSNLNAEFTTNNAKEDYTYTVTGEGGTKSVSAPWKQGQTYSIKLKDSSAARLVVDGVEQLSTIRVLNIITEKGEVENLKLDSENIKFISRAQVSNMSDSLAGLFSVSLAESKSGDTVISQVADTGSFDYAGGDITVGDTVAIYEGTKPDERSIVEGASNNDSVVYVEITSIRGNTYSYRTADTEDVLFTPDILPVSDSVDQDSVANQITVALSDMDFSGPQYAELGLNAETTVDEGDFIAFYSGGYGTRNAAGPTYARITGVSGNDTHYVITYTEVSQEVVLAAMDIYDSRNEQVELTDQQIREMESDMVNQAVESGFVEEAAQYLTALALETDGFQELSDDLDMDLSSYSITFADGTPVDPGTMDLMAVKAEITKKDVDANVMAGTLVHFEDGTGLRAELVMTFTVEIEGSSGNKLEITMQAIFEQEILLTINVSGGAVWKWAWIIPYIYDYNMNANIDVGTYTGIAVTATAKTVGKEEEDEGYDWKPVSGTKFEEKVVSIGKQITDLMAQKDEFMGKFTVPTVNEDGEEVESAGTITNGGLAEKYAAMMEDAEESWIEIVRVELFSSEGHVDPFHILCYGISADFVVSANLYVTIGMTFEYGVAKRYNFSLMLFHKQVSNETIDLEEAHYQFDFYVMGTIGVRAGVEFEIAMGLFSLKLDSIGITVEVGAYAQLWGYFYYHLSWSESGGKDSSYSGAMAIEIGLYLTITFKAQLFSSDKLTYQPTLYDNNWPLLVIGEVENVYDFAYPEDPSEIEDPAMQAIVEDMLNRKAEVVKTIPVPSELFFMNYMDMKTGELHGSDSEDGDDEDEDPDNPMPGDFDDETESHFLIEFTNLSNPGVFAYDPESNQIIVTPSTSYSTEESGQMVITWKGASLAFSSRALQRTVNIEWTNMVDVMSISFDSNGGTPIEGIVAKVTAPITWPEDPVRAGYRFVGWKLYDWDSGEYLNTLYDVKHTTMPDFDNAMDGILLKAVWAPNENIPYSVELYQEQLQEVSKNNYYTSTEYALMGTLNYNDGVSGTVKHLANDVLSRANAEMRLKPNGQVSYLDLESSEMEKTIAPDGSTVFKLYYKLGNANIKFERGGYGDKSFSVDPAIDTLVYNMKAGSVLYVPNMIQPGYKLIGFAPDSNDLSIPANGHLTVPGYDVTYTAEWEPATDTPYEIHYYGEDGYGNYLPLQIVEKTGTTDTTASVSDVDWLAFANYEPDKTNGNNVLSGTISADGNTVLKLYYTIKRYAVTFDLTGKPLTGGTGVPGDLSSEVIAGGTIPEWAPASTGYVFVGWYTKNGTANGNWGEAYDFSTPVTEPLTLYAKWEEAGQELTVRHHVMKADGTYEVFTAYVQKDNNNLIFKTGVTVELENLADAQYLTEGFAYNAQKAAVGDTAASTYTIPAADLAEIHLYYDRQSYRFEDWDIDGVNDLPGVVTKNPQDYTPGAISGSIFYLYGMPMVAPVLECPGYTFQGWDPEFTGTMPARSVRYTAIWEANTDTPYTVEFYLEDADGTYYKDSAENLTGTTGAAVSLSAYGDKYTDAHGGYRLNADKTGADSWTIAADGSLIIRIYYEREERTLTFLVDGEQYGTITQKWGTTLAESSFPADPTKEGATFYQWEPIYNVMPNADATVTAKWNINYYNLQWNLNGGTDGNPNQTTSGYLAHGTAIVAPTPVREGYDFAGWNVAIPATLTGDLTVTAQWSPWTTTVNFHANVPDGASALALSGSMPSMTAAYGGNNSYTNAFALSGTGFTPMNWNTKADGSGTTYSLDGNIANSFITKGGTIDLYLQWSAAPVSYKIVLYVQPATDDFSQEPTYTFTRTAGVGTWLTLNEAFLAADAEIAAKIPFEHFYIDNPTQHRLSNDPDQAIILYVMRENYTLTFQANGGTWEDGTTADKTLTGRYDAPFTAPVPYMEGMAYTWSPALDGTTFAGNGTYTANWTDAKYTVEWVVDGETVETDTNVAYGAAPSFDGKTPTKDDDAQYTYTLVWSDGTNTYAPDALPTVTDDVTYTAVFTGTTRVYTVSWDPMGGSGEYTSGEYEYGKYVEVPADPTKEGCTFAGWLDSASGTFVSGRSEYHGVTVRGEWHFEAQWLEPSGDYDLWIGDTRVNAENAGDVFGDGTVRYFVGSNTLYLNDYTYEGAGITQIVDEKYQYSASGHIVYSGTQDLNIVVNGTNTLTLTDESEAAIRMFNVQTLSLSGSGTLNINTPTKGIYVATVTESGFVIIDEVTLNIASTKENSLYGILASVTVNSGEVTCTTTDTKLTDGYSFWASSCVMNGGTVTVTADAREMTVNGGEYRQAHVEHSENITVGTGMEAKAYFGNTHIYGTAAMKANGSDTAEIALLDADGYAYVPSDYWFTDGRYTDLHICPEGELEKGDYYLWIGTTAVTAANAEDVFGDGMVSYDLETNTLTLTELYELSHYGVLTNAATNETLRVFVLYNGQKPLTIRKYDELNLYVEEGYVKSLFGGEIIYESMGSGLAED